MATVHFTRQARNDLLEIWSYIAEHSGLPAADRAYDVLDEGCGLLREHPRLGPAREEIAPEARSLVIQRWVVLYRVTQTGVQIARVLDGARDLAKIEWAPE